MWLAITISVLCIQRREELARGCETEHSMNKLIRTMCKTEGARGTRHKDEDDKSANSRDTGHHTFRAELNT
jgi:hypothetical protein